MLIIFDCDGVLVNSEPLAAKAFSQCLAKNNIHLNAEECFKQFRGHTLTYCFRWLERHFSVKLPEGFSAQLERATTDVFDCNLLAVEGVIEILELLSEKHIPFCVASNGSHKKIRHSLELTGLAEFFPEHRFSREDVVEGKPSPKLFLYAAEKMGVAPEQTTVIEDSQAGLQAALAAGMHAIYYNVWGVRDGVSARIEDYSHMRDIKRCLQLN